MGGISSWSQRLIASIGFDNDLTSFITQYNSNIGLSSVSIIIGCLHDPSAILIFSSCTATRSPFCYSFFFPTVIQSPASTSSGSRGTGLAVTVKRESVKRKIELGINSEDTTSKKKEQAAEESELPCRK